MINITAYITLLSSLDYLNAVFVLNDSLRECNSKYPLICAVTEDLYNAQLLMKLIAAGIIVERIPQLHYSDNIQQQYFGQPVLNTASKIGIFNLTHYDKLCYIDADALIVSNIDDVFEYLDGSMVKYDEDDFGFTGFFIFCPNNHSYDYYLTLLTQQDCFDGNLLGYLWFYTRTSTIHQIPEKYFMTYREDYNFSNIEVKVWHFCNMGKKPWIEEDRKNMINTPVLELYDKYLIKYL